MCPPYSRRAVLSLGGGVAISSIAGCLQNDSQSTPTSERRTTITCEDQEIAPDISVWNRLSSSHTVTVTLKRRENGEETLFFERTYEAPAGNYVEESEKIFTDWKGGECIAEVATESGWSATGDVTYVTQSPWNYGVQVELSEEVDNIAVYDYHFDPGETDNHNCY